MITIYPVNVHADSTGALVVLTAPPNRAVTWVRASGDGTLTPLTNYTDAQGRAAAMYVPGTAGTAPVIEAHHGA